MFWNMDRMLYALKQAGLKATLPNKMIRRYKKLLLQEGEIMDRDVIPRTEHAIHGVIAEPLCTLNAMVMMFLRMRRTNQFKLKPVITRWLGSLIDRAVQGLTN